MRNAAILLLTLALAPAMLAAGLLGNAEMYTIDTTHSYVGFTARFLGMTDVRGNFRDYGATIIYDDDRPERTSVTAVIDVASLDTSSQFRDRDLKAETFFDVAKYPNIIFQSTRVESLGKERYVVHGNLTIKGVTRAISIPMTRTVKRVKDEAWGAIRIGGAGAITIKRSDFGILGNEFWGKKVVGDEVTLTLEILGQRPNYEGWTFDSAKKPSIGEVVWKTVEASGGAAAAQQFRELKRDKPDDYNFAPWQIGLAINRLVFRGKLADALELLRAATEAYPQEAGFFSRSGEVYAQLGDRENALAMYEKSSAIAPVRSESMEMLRQLRRP